LQIIDIELHTQLLVVDDPVVARHETDRGIAWKLKIIGVVALSDAARNDAAAELQSAPIAFLQFVRRPDAAIVPRHIDQSVARVACGDRRVAVGVEIIVVESAVLGDQRVDIGIGSDHPPAGKNFSCNVQLHSLVPHFTRRHRITLRREDRIRVGRRDILL
jgi:hypothetical protein